MVSLEQYIRQGEELFCGLIDKKISITNVINWLDGASGDDKLIEEIENNQRASELLDMLVMTTLKSSSNNLLYSVGDYSCWWSDYCSKFKIASKADRYRI
jgi:hypothetical protein